MNINVKEFIPEGKELHPYVKEYWENLNLFYENVLNGRFDEALENEKVASDNLRSTISWYEKNNIIDDKIIRHLLESFKLNSFALQMIVLVAEENGVDKISERVKEEQEKAVAILNYLNKSETL
jgi:hypothetical protein